jgi:hypothetical protein
MFIYRVFSAMRNLKRFVAIDAIGRVIQIALYGLLTSGYGIFPSLGLVGIPATDICINFLLCAVMLYHLRKKIGSYGLTQIVGNGVKTLIAAVLSVAPTFAFLLFYPVQGALLSFIALAGFGILSLVLYYWLCRLLRVPEIDIAQRMMAKVLGVIRRGR